MKWINQTVICAVPLSLLLFGCSLDLKPEPGPMYYPEEGITVTLIIKNEFSENVTFFSTSTYKQTVMESEHTLELAPKREGLLTLKLGRVFGWGAVEALESRISFLVTIKSPHLGTRYFAGWPATWSSEILPERFGLGYFNNVGTVMDGKPTQYYAWISELYTEWGAKANYGFQDNNVSYTVEVKEDGVVTWKIAEPPYPLQ